MCPPQFGGSSEPQEAPSLVTPQHWGPLSSSKGLLGRGQTACVELTTPPQPLPCCLAVMEDVLELDGAEGLGGFRHPW